MLRIAEKPKYNNEILEILKDWSTSSTLEARMIERAKIVLKSIEGRAGADIAKGLGMRPNTVGMWRHRSIELGQEGLFDRPRPGKPHKYDDLESRKAVLEMLEYHRQRASRLGW
jgi:hypothetical protein